MSTPRNALNLTISAATVLDSGTQPLTGPPIANYQGESLYCHAGISGSTLTITVDQNPKNNLDPASRQRSASGAPPGTVTDAMVTVTYKGTTAGWSAPQPVQYDGALLAWSMRLSPDFSQAFLYVVEAVPPSAPVAGQEDATLGFVLVQDDAQPEAPYRILWVENPVTVPDYPHHNTATIVLPYANVVGIIGPMGVEIDMP